MYRRTIWQDHVEGIQQGTDMNAANFNNIEAGTMEAHALAALDAVHRRYDCDVSKNCESVAVEATLTGSGASHNISIPGGATRNKTDYKVVAEVKSVTGGTAGDIIPTSKTTSSFDVKYNGTATSIDVIFYISGGMI